MSGKAAEVISWVAGAERSGAPAEASDYRPCWGTAALCPSHPVDPALNCAKTGSHGTGIPSCGTSAQRLIRRSRGPIKPCGASAACLREMTE